MSGQGQPGGEARRAGDIGAASDKLLRRSLGKFELLYLSLGGIIGSGWLFGPLYTAQYAGGSAILSWIIGGIFVIFVGLAYAELGSAIPKSGGIVRYPHYTHGGIAGFILTWAYFLSAVSVPAIEAVGAVTYLSSLYPPLTSNGVLTPLGIAVAYLLLIAFFIINYAGVNVLGKTIHGLGWWKLMIPVITIVILLVTVLHPNNFTLGGGFFPSAENVAGGSSGIAGFAAVLYAIPTTGVIFSYLGFRQAVEYGGEGKNPQKDIPFAVIGALLIALAVYTLLQVSFIGAIDWNQLNVTPGNWTGLGSSVLSNGPLYEILRTSPVAGAVLALFTVWAYILLLDAVVSPSGTGLIYLGTGTRTIYGFAANGYLPEVFLRIGRTRIPIASLIAATVIAAIFMLPFPSWQSLAGFISSATVFTYIMGGIGLETLRRTAPELQRPYRLPGAKVLAPIATLAAGLIVYWSGFATLYYVISAIMLGMALFFAYYTYKYLGMNKGASIAIGVINLVGVLGSAYYLYNSTSALSTANNLAFAVYMISLLAITVLDLAVLRFLAKTDEARREVKASVWLFAYILLMTVLSYFGSFGLNPIIPFPTDTVVAAVLTLGAHYGAVYTGFRTQAIEDVLEELKQSIQS